MSPDKIYVNDINPDVPIYRVFKIDHFFELLGENRLRLVKPKLWEDPGEDLLSNLEVEHSKYDSTSYLLTTHYFGQCWTLKPECDGIWRNYSGLENGVLVKTTPRQLLTHLNEYNEIDNQHPLSIGKVEYHPASCFAKLLGSKGFLDSLKTRIGITKSLLLKRIEFSYEQEVRLLGVFDKNQDFFRLRCFPSDFIDEVIFSPKMSHYRYHAYLRELQDRYSFSELKVKRSSLYNPVRLKVKDER